MIMAVIGPEGGGKTCFMTYLALKHVSLGGTLQTFPGYTVTNGAGKQISQPITTEEWITMAPTLRDTVICIDEVQNFFNSAKYMTTLNYLFTNLAAQRRHRNLGLIYTVQDWGWTDKRIRYLTHILASCRDLYWSPWGKERNLKRGELLSVSFWDIKGFYTGQQWTQAGSFTLKAKPIWDCYDSYCDVDIWSGLSKVDIKKPTYVVDLNKPAGDNPDIPIPGPGPDLDTGDDTALLDELTSVKGVKPQTISKLARRLLFK